MTPDQIVAFVLALTSPPSLDPLFPVIAAGGADPRYPVVATACPRPSRSRAARLLAARCRCQRITKTPKVSGSA